MFTNYSWYLTTFYLSSLPNLTLQFCFGRYSCHIWQKLLQSNSTRKNPRRRIEGGGWMWLYKLFISIILLLVSAFKYNASNLMKFFLVFLYLDTETSWSFRRWTRRSLDGVTSQPWWCPTPWWRSSRRRLLLKIVRRRLKGLCYECHRLQRWVQVYGEILSK